MNREPLTVSALTKYIKYLFDHDKNLTQVLLKGEISNFTHHTRGHFYFTLKDEEAQLRAIMFKSNADNVKFKVEDGMKVIVEGYVSVYVSGGTYQITVNSLQLDGVGDLYVRFEQLKEKLGKEGLFDDRYKKPIPRFPKRIAVLTSTTGAAIRDIITTIERRYKACEIIVFPTLVQGETAKYAIVDSLTKANADSSIDVIILGRGGGSIEDLWAFNEEEVAYAIFKSKIPIISAVGHETDFTISDFVSDIRAATPTAAAELAVPNTRDVLVYLDQQRSRLSQQVANLFKRQEERLSRIHSSYIFQNPARLLEQYYYQVDRLQKRLEMNSPKVQLQLSSEQLKTLRKGLNYHYQSMLIQKRNQFVRIAEKLELVNPLNLLSKGYAIVKKGEEPVTSSAEVNLHDELTIELKDGVLNVQVKEKGERRYE